MLLAVDVGNTQTVLGLYDGDRLTEQRRLATEASRTGDELGALLGELLDLESVDGICLSSTVPALVREFELFAERWAQAPILVVGPGAKTGIPVRYDDPREVGPDRVVNAVAARERYGSPCISVDFGTSTNFDVVSADGEYVGGVLAPGIGSSSTRAASPRQNASRSSTDRRCNSLYRDIGCIPRRRPGRGGGASCAPHPHAGGCMTLAPW